MAGRALDNVDLAKFRQLGEEVSKRADSIMRNPVKRAYIESCLAEYDELLTPAPSRSRKAEKQPDPDHRSQGFIASTAQRL